MPIQIVKPTTAGQRKMSKLKRVDIATSVIPKSLRLAKKQYAGRNNQGKITIRHRGGGEKRFLRIIDFKRDKTGEATVLELQYDPNRTAHIALVQYTDGERRYILAPSSLKVGDTVVAAEKTPIRPGNHLLLKHIPIGSAIHSISLRPDTAGSVVRSAGNQATLLSLEETTAHIRLPSGEVRKFDNTCRATLGSLSNADWQHVRLGKAGRTRHFGRKPTVRGKAMNPVDHPHGGGEGNTSIGLPGPKTPWGKPALGRKTRKRNLASSAFIVRRRKTR